MFNLHCLLYNIIPHTYTDTVGMCMSEANILAHIYKLPKLIYALLAVFILVSVRPLIVNYMFQIHHTPSLLFSIYRLNLIIIISCHYCIIYTILSWQELKLLINRNHNENDLYIFHLNVIIAAMGNRDRSSTASCSSFRRILYGYS